VVRLNAGRESFAQTDMPGIYTIQSPAGNQVFALNLPAKECQTDVMPIEDLEGFGVLLAQSLVISTEQTGLSGRVGLGQPNHYGGAEPHPASFAGLESEQKIWRWIIIGLLTVSFIEIILAGWLTRCPSKYQGEQK
jgi:hypothetical protein